MASLSSVTLCQTGVSTPSLYTMLLVLVTRGNAANFFSLYTTIVKLKRAFIEGAQVSSCRLSFSKSSSFHFHSYCCNHLIEYICCFHQAFLTVRSRTVLAEDLAICFFLLSFNKNVKHFQYMWNISKTSLDHVLLAGIRYFSRSSRISSIR